MKPRSITWLIGSWAAYWSALFAVKLGPAVLAIWSASRSKVANDSSAGVSFANWVLSLVVTEHGATTWSGSVHMGALAAWIAVVPLAIWVA
ncbi:MAG TPA: hypothetical protein VGH04_08840, partial [Gemmatimonadaceae bacterium]